MADFDRRTFLGVSALALSTELAFAADPPEWFDRPMRWAQLTLVEDDPGKYDANSGWTTSSAPTPTRPA